LLILNRYQYTILITQEQIKPIELRRIMEFSNKSHSRGITIPPEWCEQLHLEPKQYVRLEMQEDGNGFTVRRILFQEPTS
jgi:hypothetical protein